MSDRTNEVVSVKSAVVEWVRRLPEVGSPLLRRVDEVHGLLDTATEFERRAAQLRLRAANAAHVLELDTEKYWTKEDIDRAKQTTG